MQGVAGAGKSRDEKECFPSPSSPAPCQVLVIQAVHDENCKEGGQQFSSGHSGRQGLGGLKGLSKQHHGEWGDEEMKAEIEKEKAVNHY